MAKKPNPILEAFAEKLQKEYRSKLETNSEFDMMALMIMLSDDLQVGPGRAAKCLNDFLAAKVEISEAILTDAKNDKEILQTKHDLAGRFKQIFGASWMDVRGWFPLLQEYWED